MPLLSVTFKPALLFLLRLLCRDILTPSYLRWGDSVHIFRGEAFQQRGLSGVVQTQKNYPDLLLCGALQLLYDREQALWRGQQGQVELIKEGKTKKTNISSIFLY